MDDEMAEKLSALEMDILEDLLIHGDNGPTNIARNTGRSRSATQTRMNDLLEKDLVEDKGSGIYKLTLTGLTTARVIHQARRR